MALTKLGDIPEGTNAAEVLEFFVPIASGVPGLLAVARGTFYELVWDVDAGWQWPWIKGSTVDQDGTGTLFQIAPGQNVPDGRPLQIFYSLDSVSESDDVASGFVTTGLTAVTPSGDKQLFTTSGYGARLDGGGDDFDFVEGDSTTANAITVVAHASGRFKRKNRAPVIDLSKAGCVHGTSSDQSAAILNAINAGLDLAAEANPGTAQRVVDIVVPNGKFYHLATPLAIPGNNTVRVRIKGGGWRIANQDAYGAASWVGSDPGVGGGGFKVAPGINAFHLSDGSGVKYLELMDLVLLGVNGGGTRKGVVQTDVIGASRFRNVAFLNLTTGAEIGNVSTPFSRDMYFGGCQLGAIVGGTDQQYMNMAFQTCAVGMFVSGHGLVFEGRTLFQNCTDALKIGDACEGVIFSYIWFEANTNSNITEDITTGYHSVDVRGCRWASPGAVPLTITSGRWNFGPSQRFGAWLNVQYPGHVSYQSQDIHPSSVVGDGGRFFFVGTEGQNGTLTPVAGVVTPNYLLTGGLASLAGLLDANLTIAAPTNMPYGQTIEVTLKQDAVGGRTISFSGFNITSGYSDAGNVANAFCVLVIHKSYPGGYWVEQTMPWSLV